MKQVLSFGAGVQSTALLLMSCKGILPKLDYAIFADTQWEPEEVYTHLEWCENYAADYGIKVARVTNGNLRDDFTPTNRNDGGRFMAIPLYVIQENGKPSMVRRQCTFQYKIKPVEKYMRREIMGLKPGQRAPKEVVIQQWMGISWDEIQRAKASSDKWKENVFPFCNMPGDYFPKPIKRFQCIEWLETNYPDIHVPRSACIGCPYHSNEEWRRIKENPKEWADAVDFDRTIRQGTNMDGEAFIHRSCKPLEEVDLRSDVEKGQNVFGWDDECDGMCGV